MDAKQQALWEKLESLEIDDPTSPLPFSVRLARENGWSLRYTQRVLIEYKRFVFLAASAGHSVCPSEEVDAVWHLHLCYTRSYWHDLCRDTLVRPLHHDPTRGGKDQLAHHQTMYDQTLSTYRQFFGQLPPDDIWPVTVERFGHGGSERHVNTAEHWVVRKPSLKSIKRSLQVHTKQWMLLASISFFPIIGAITNPLEMRGSEFLTLYFWLTVLTVSVGIAIRLVFRQADDGSLLPELDAYEAATLALGTENAITLAVADLALNDAIVVEGVTNQQLLPSVGTPAKHPLPQSIFQRIVAERNCSLLDARSRARPEAAKIAAHLENKDLLESATSFAAVRWLPVLLLGGVLLLGLAKIAVGLSRDKPVLFLVLLSVGVAIAIWKFYQIPFRTKRGDRALDQLKKHYQDNGSELEADDETGYQLLGTSLFGLTSLAAAGGLGAEIYGSLKATTKSSTWTGIGCGVGCGGGGGGGCGGGGCGGCGGS